VSIVAFRGGCVQRGAVRWDIFIETRGKGRALLGLDGRDARPHTSTLANIAVVDLLDAFSSGDGPRAIGRDIGGLRFL
jgi:hypothetical protein